MTPTELTQHDVASGGERRNVYCPAYSRCLDQAVMKGWDDWTCRRCQRFTVSNGPSIDTYARSRRSDAD